MAISLTQLLAEIGDDKVMVQMLSSALDGQQQVGRDGRPRYRFVSDEPLAGVALTGERNAFIVWADQADIAAAYKRLQKQEKARGAG